MKTEKEIIDYIPNIDTDIKLEYERKRVAVAQHDKIWEEQYEITERYYMGWRDALQWVLKVNPPPAEKCECCGKVKENDIK